MHYLGTEENNYYRWRVFSFLQGDTETLWRMEPFMISENGCIWYPPEIITKRIYFYNETNFLKIKQVLTFKNKKLKRWFLIIVKALNLKRSLFHKT
jgi:hypothetical protein